MVTVQDGWPFSIPSRTGFWFTQKFQRADMVMWPRAVREVGIFRSQHESIKCKAGVELNPLIQEGRRNR